jgi:phosphatidylglycerophosphate synthase
MAGAAGTVGETRARPRELEDPLNLFLYHPLAARLARLLVPTPVTPNMVSATSLLALLAASWAFCALPWPTDALAGLGFMLLWHVVDGADGDLARMTGRASPTGEFVDGLCDYFGNIVMYVAFAAWLDDSLGGWAWGLAAAAGASHLIQTNHAETERRLYLSRAYGVPWLRSEPALGGADWVTRTFGFLGVAYLRVSEWMSPSGNPIDKALKEAAGDPAAIERLRRAIRAASPGSRVLEKALGANPKTFLIAASVALGSPLYYFLTMISAINLILLVSIVVHRRVARRLAAELSAG